MTPSSWKMPVAHSWPWHHISVVALSFHEPYKPHQLPITQCPGGSEGSFCFSLSVWVFDSWRCSGWKQQPDPSLVGWKLLHGSPKAFHPATESDNPFGMRQDIRKQTPKSPESQRVINVTRNESLLYSFPHVW